MFGILKRKKIERTAESVLRIEDEDIRLRFHDFYRVYFYLEVSQKLGQYLESEKIEKQIEEIRSTAPCFYRNAFEYSLEVMNILLKGIKKKYLKEIYVKLHSGENTNGFYESICLDKKYNYITLRYRDQGEEYTFYIKMKENIQLDKCIFTNKSIQFVIEKIDNSGKRKIEVTKGSSKNIKEVEEIISKIAYADKLYNDFYNALYSNNLE